MTTDAKRARDYTQLNYRLWMDGNGGSEPPQEWQDGYNAALSSQPESVSDTTQALIDQLRSRDAAGRAKYGVTLDRDDLSHADWLQHMAEELLDAAGYALAAKRTTPDAALADTQRALIEAAELRTYQRAQGERRVYQCGNCPTSVETAAKEPIACLRCGSTMVHDASAKPAQPDGVTTLDERLLGAASA